MSKQQKKECPSCAMEIDEAAGVCPVCGYEFATRVGLVRWIAILLILLAIVLLIIGL